MGNAKLKRERQREKERERGRIDTSLLVNGHNVSAYLRSAYAMHDASERFPSGLREGSRSLTSNKNYAVRSNESVTANEPSRLLEETGEANFVTCRCRFASTHQANAHRG